MQTATAHPAHTNTFAQDVTGLVTDNQGAPVEGASVFIRPGNKGTVTGKDGRFTFTGIEPGSYTLEISFVGFQKQMQTITVKEGSAPPVNITLVRNDDKTEATVVVTAFGIAQQKRALGYSVQEVKAQALTESHQSNLVNALQGKVAGVQITNSGGAPGASSMMLIRGGTSLSGNNQPLYVIDGIPIDNNTQVSQGTNLVAQSVLASCKKYLDINKDPNNPSTVPAHARLIGAITTTNGASMWRGAREITGVTQYGVTKLLAGTNRNAETWRFTASYFFWQNAYVFTMPNCVDLIALGKQEGNLHFSGVGQILLALNYGMLTDQYGSIVSRDFYDAVSQIKLLPRMDDQQSAYAIIDSLLTDAITLLQGTNTVPLNFSNGDIMYQGNIDKWTRLAWSLKARYLNHLSKKGSLYNATSIIDACNKGFNADGMDAEFAYIAGAQQTDESPWASWGGFTSLTDPRYFTWSQFFVDVLTKFPVTNTAFQDPRIGKIMKPAASDGIYRGLRPGAGLAGGQDGTGVKTAEADYGPFSKSGFYTNATSPFPFITYSELKLIQAEAMLRSNDKAGALTAYEEGVKANLRKLGVAATDINLYWAAQLADGLVVHFDNLTQGLSHIMRQKYITQCLNPETWVDMRRMDYSKDIYGPSLRRPANINTVIFDPGNESQWIRGMVYETNEQNRNPQAVGDNSEKYRLLTPLWWDTP